MFTPLGAMTNAQAAYAALYWSRKPRLRMRNGEWHCIGDHTHVHAPTIAAAFERWLIWAGRN